MSTAAALRTLAAQIETLPAPDSHEFITAASRVLHELRKLDVTASVANELDGEELSIPVDRLVSGDLRSS